ncbi:MAG TPA: hypothetical protein VHO84_05615 [Syntrophorhabdaceae bacterium]|nr:hypothetical protein [Syntrophorhabdaceae bacterium]
MSLKPVKLLLVLLISILAVSCASTNCDYNTNIRPDPISITAEEGAFYGTNYSACFIMDGIIFKEPISECAYRYYYNRKKGIR